MVYHFDYKYYGNFINCVFIVNFEYIFHLALVFLFSLWTCECRQAYAVFIFIYTEAVFQEKCSSNI